MIDINKKTKINTKLFCGIHIYDYQIKSDNKDETINIFDNKKIYETKIRDKNYMMIRKIFKDENLKVVNLIGKNGIINRQEYVKNPINKISENA